MLILTSNKPDDLVNTLVDNLSYEQLLNLYMSTVHFQDPSIPVKELYMQALKQGSYDNVVKGDLKFFLKEMISCPTPLLIGNDDTINFDYHNEVDDKK